MVKTAGNTLEWEEHDLTVLGKGGYRIRAGSTFNIIGGELLLGQAFAMSLHTTQTPVNVIDDLTRPTTIRKLYDYSVHPLTTALDHTKTKRISGTGIQDFLMGGYYLGTTPKVYRFKILATGTPDTFQYRTSTDGGTTFTGWTTPTSGGTITGTIQPIAEGLTIKFTATTGHTIGDEWEFWTPMPQRVEAAVQTVGSGEVLTTAIKSISGKLTNEALDDSETVVTVDGSHGIVVNDVIVVDVEKMHVTGVSTNDLTVTRGYDNTTAVTHLDNAPVNIVVTASHRQVFVVKIIFGHASTQNTFKYSTDGGITFDNGGGSTDGSGNLNIPGSPFTHTLRDADNVSYGITITFSAIAGYTTNDAFSFHAFPTRKIPVFKPSSEKIFLAWVENRGETKVKHKFLTSTDLESTESLNLPSNVSIANTGITFGGQNLSQSTIASGTSNQYSTFNSYFNFADVNNVALGGIAGQKTSVTNNYAPWVSGVRGADNTDYAHYIFDRGSTIDFPILDMNRGMINNLTSLSQSVHTQGDYGEQMGTVTLAMDTTNGAAWLFTKVGNTATADGEINVNQILALVPAGGNQWSTVKYDDVTELVKVTAIDQVAPRYVTLTRGWNPATGASEANLIKTFDAGAGLWRSWDDSAAGGPTHPATSGARQHVRIPPNNALTSKTTQGSVTGWAGLADIEANGKGPWTLVLETNQAASTGLPDAPWNTQWRQQGGSWGNLEVTGSNTVVPDNSANGIDNDVLTFVGGSGITATGDNSAKSITFATSSSKRYKENIEKLTLDTSKLYNLTPRTFTWKEDAPVAEQGQSDFGLIAEEVEEIFPEITFNNAGGQIEGVQYIKLSVLLLEELKKLKKRIEILEGSN